MGVINSAIQFKASLLGSDFHHYFPSYVPLRCMTLWAVFTKFSSRVLLARYLCNFYRKMHPFLHPWGQHCYVSQQAPLTNHRNCFRPLFTYLLRNTIAGNFYQLLYLPLAALLSACAVRNTSVPRAAITASDLSSPCVVENEASLLLSLPTPLLISPSSQTISSFTWSSLYHLQVITTVG